MLEREVTRVVVSDEEYRAAQLVRGYPEWMVEMLGSLFRATRAREFDVVDPTLERVLRRRPRAFAETLRTFLGEG